MIRGFPKRGTRSAGVQPQYCGVSGRVENCQVGVFLSYVTALGHGLIDRELYLPEDWCHDAARRRAAHIPEAVRFQTKPELALRMVHRAQSAHLPIRWVVADTVYGHSPDLRLCLEEQGYAYALAVPSTEVVCVQTQAGCLLSDVASIAQQALCAQDWQRLSQSQGTKGERLFDWARLPVFHRGLVDHRHWLVLRRCLDDPTELAYYLVFAPLATPLSTMVQAIGARWRIEEDLEARHPTLGSITMKSAAMSAGIVISPSSCSPLPSWSGFACKRAIRLLLHRNASRHPLPKRSLL